MSGTTDKLMIVRGTQDGTDFSYNSSDSSTVIEVCFNPTDYTVTNSNNFEESRIPGLQAPVVQFKQGNTSTLSLELLLDTQFNDDYTKTDIRDAYIYDLEKLMAIDSDIHAPPPCQVLWGSLEFTGMLESMDKKYTLFSSDGTPVRARVTLKFKEYVSLDLQIQEASLASPNRRKMFTVNEGDSLWRMAYRAYGDPGFMACYR